jgi:hypothetical protein
MYAHNDVLYNITKQHNLQSCCCSFIMYPSPAEWNMIKAGNISLVLKIRNVLKIYRYCYIKRLYFFNIRLFIKRLTFIILKIGGSNRLRNRYTNTLRKSNPYRIESNLGGIAHHYYSCRVVQKCNKNKMIVLPWQHWSKREPAFSVDQWIILNVISMFGNYERGVAACMYF